MPKPDSYPRAEAGVVQSGQENSQIRNCIPGKPITRRILRLLLRVRSFYLQRMREPLT